MACSNRPDTHFIREVAIRYVGRARKAPDVIRAPLDAVGFMRRAVTDDAREHFLALYLDGRHRPLAHQVVSVGTATASLVHPREVFQPAILTCARAVIVGHNHPSGDPSPSGEDRDVTRRLARAGELLGIRLLDSLVWTGGGAFASLKEIAADLFAGAAKSRPHTLRSKPSRSSTESRSSPSATADRRYRFTRSRLTALPERFLALSRPHFHDPQHQLRDIRHRTLDR